MTAYVSTAEAERRFGLSCARLWSAARSRLISEPVRLSPRRTLWRAAELPRLAKIAQQFARADAQEAV